MSVFNLEIEGERLARKYFLAMKMTPKEMATFRRYANVILSKDELETIRAMRARFMQRKRLRKMI